MSVSAVVKAGAVLQKRLARYERRNDDAFLAARAELALDWGAEVKVGLRKLVERGERKAAAVDDSLKEMDARLSLLLEDAEVEILLDLYAQRGAQEAHRERRLMLSHAATTIVDLETSIEEKCRVEKVLRDLDPTDVIELDRIARVAGYIERVSDGRARSYLGEGQFRYAVVDRSRSRDALVSSGCIREVAGHGFGSSYAEPVLSSAHVTPRGRLVLHTLRSYVAPRRVLAPGRELPPEARRESEARACLARNADVVALAVTLTHRARRSSAHRVQFDALLASADGPRSLSSPFLWPHAKATELTRLVLSPVEQADLRAFPRKQDDLAIEATDTASMPMSATITGPFDVLYWFAEDLDASWGFRHHATP
jgi:hypothetical protein